MISLCTDKAHLQTKVFGNVVVICELSFLHLELLFQTCPAIVPWCCDSVKVAVKLT